MTQQQTATTGVSNSTSATIAPNLYPVLESTIEPLDECDRNQAIVQVEKDLVRCLGGLHPDGNLFQDIVDKSILPVELFTSNKRVIKPKINPLERLNELPGDEVEDEEEQDEEEEDEEQEIIEDEEEDAGGDYLVSHFDNGENYEDNEDEGDEMSSMM